MFDSSLGDFKFPLGNHSLKWLFSEPQFNHLWLMGVTSGWLVSQSSDPSFLVSVVFSLCCITWTYSFLCWFSTSDLENPFLQGVVVAGSMSGCYSGYRASCVLCSDLNCGFPKHPAPPAPFLQPDLQAGDLWALLCFLSPDWPPFSSLISTAVIKPLIPLFGLPIVTQT